MLVRHVRFSAGSGPRDARIGRENSSGASLLAGPYTTLVQHRLFRCPKCARTMQLRGDLSTIGHRPNRVALPEKLNPLQLNLLQLLTSFVEFPAGASELRFQPCN